MKPSNTFDESQWPGLALAYESVKGVLEVQYQSKVNLDNKAAGGFGLATATVGIGLPIGLAQLDNLVWLALAALVLPLGLYATALGLFLASYRPGRVIQTVSNPHDYDDEWRQLQPGVFRWFLLDVIKKHFDANEAYLEKHLKRVNWILRLTVVVGLLVAAWVGLVGTLNALQEPEVSVEMEEAVQAQDLVAPIEGEEAVPAVVDAE